MAIKPKQELALASDAQEVSSASPTTKTSPASAAAKKARKDVQGNLSYSFTPSRFREVLQALIGAERPATFNRDFIETVLNVRGGSVSGFPPILKRLGFLASDNTPTELYAQFQTDSHRSAAALAGLKNGFAELFKRNAHIHKADDNKIRDYLVQITGRKKDDSVVNAVLGTFNAIKSFIGNDADADLPPITENLQLENNGKHAVSTSGLGLSYHINIVLPETKDIAVFNAIFSSLKQNLLS